MHHESLMCHWSLIWLRGSSQVYSVLTPPSLKRSKFYSQDFIPFLSSYSEILVPLPRCNLFVVSFVAVKFVHKRFAASHLTSTHWIFITDYFSWGSTAELISHVEFEMLNHWTSSDRSLMQLISRTLDLNNTRNEMLYMIWYSVMPASQLQRLHSKSHQYAFFQWESFKQFSHLHLCLKVKLFSFKFYSDKFCIWIFTCWSLKRR